MGEGRVRVWKIFESPLDIIIQSQSLRPPRQKEKPAKAVHSAQKYGHKHYGIKYSGIFPYCFQNQILAPKSISGRDPANPKIPISDVNKTILALRKFTGSYEYKSLFLH